jgi:hypothetical protein
VAVLGLLGLVVAVGIVGSGSRVHLQGTNDLRPFGFDVTIPAGKTACQPYENVPSGTGGVRVRAGTFGKPGPRVALSLEPAGSSPVRGGLAPGWREGDVTIPVTEVQGDRLGVRVCLTNHGPGQIALAGEPFAANFAARVGAQPEPGRARLEYMRPHADSWWGLLGTLADRVGTVRGALPGAATLYLWALLGLGVAGGAVALVLREGRE